MDRKSIWKNAATWRSNNRTRVSENRPLDAGNGDNADDVEVEQHENREIITVSFSHREREVPESDVEPIRPGAIAVSSRQSHPVVVVDSHSSVEQSDDNDLENAPSLPGEVAGHDATIPVLEARRVETSELELQHELDFYRSQPVVPAILVVEEGPHQQAEEQQYRDSSEDNNESTEDESAEENTDEPNRYCRQHFRVFALLSMAVVVVVIIITFTLLNSDEKSELIVPENDSDFVFWELIGEQLEGQNVGDHFGVTSAFSGNGSIVAIAATEKYNDSGSGYVKVFQYVPFETQWIQMGQDLIGENTGDLFGSSIALSAEGTVLAVGAPGDNTAGTLSGYVRTYQYENGSWEQRGQKINEKIDDEIYNKSLNLFRVGESVGLSGDGRLLLVGSRRRTDGGSMIHVRTYEYFGKGKRWEQFGSSPETGIFSSEFRRSVVLSGDGDTLAVGDPRNGNTGTVWVLRYNQSASEWKTLGSSLNGKTAGDQYGSSIGLSSDGTIVAVGAPLSGVNGASTGIVQVYQFNSTAGEWYQMGKELEGKNSRDVFGSSVAVSGDGKVLGVGAPLNDQKGINAGHVIVYAFDNFEGNWVQLGQILHGDTPGGQLGTTLAMSSNGTAISAGSELSAYTSGRISVFVKTMSDSLPPTPAPFIPNATSGPPGQCFYDSFVLKSAVDEYLDNSSNDTVIALTYGWPIGSWCVSQIIDFSHLFSADRNPTMALFNEDIASWKLSSAITTDFMFYGASLFNQNLSMWDVGSVQTMASMFRGASAFNQNLSSWDTSQVTDMASMFSFATSFNADLSSWNVSKVRDTNGMFLYAEAFNQDLSAWDVSSVRDMNTMFAGALTFNGNISTWQVLNVEDMFIMFENAPSFNVDITAWNVSKVRNMNGMFYTAESFNQDLSTWDVSSVRDMSMMFARAYAFNGNISAWQVSNVDDMTAMFEAATIFNSDISSWDVSHVRNMTGTFYKAKSFNQDLSKWDVSSVIDMRLLLASASSFNGNVSTWEVSNVESMLGMFDAATAFNGDISSWNVSKVLDMYHMFYLTKLNQDLSSWDVSSVKNMNQMFAETPFNADISSWDVSNVEYMEVMFAMTDDFDQNISRWNVSNVRNMRGMFALAVSFNQDISSWDVSSVENTQYMFEQANSFNQDISSWNLSSANYTVSMFINAAQFNHSLCSWGPTLAANNANVYNMFRGARSCPTQAKPNLTANPPGPFCHLCK